MTDIEFACNNILNCRNMSMYLSKDRATCFWNALVEYVNENEFYKYDLLKYLNKTSNVYIRMPFLKSPVVQCIYAPRRRILKRYITEAQKCETKQEIEELIRTKYDFTSEERKPDVHFLSGWLKVTSKTPLKCFSTLLTIEDGDLFYKCRKGHPCLLTTCKICETECSSLSTSKLYII